MLFASGNSIHVKMEFFVYTFNYLSLFKAIIYAEKIWGIDKTHIIYLDLVTSPPERLTKKNYNVHLVYYDEYYKEPKIRKLQFFTEALAHKKIAKDLMNYIKQETKECNEKISLVVFHDNYHIDILLINFIKRNYPSAEVILMEEGLALYATEQKIKMSTTEIIKKCYLKLIGIPPFVYKGLPHGCNPAIDKIICKHPESLIGKRQDKGNNLIQEIDIFSEENSEKLINYVLNYNIPKDSFEFVFLSQPLFQSVNSQLREKYDRFLNKLCKITTKYGKLLIKPHPDDSWDYTVYRSEKVMVCDERVTKCPFECLMGFYGNPQSITLHSSAGFNNSIDKPCIFLYGMFPEIIRQDIFDEQFIKDNNILKCNSFDELEKAIGKNT